MYRLVDSRLEQLGLTIEEPPDTTRLHWDVSHAWLTVDGNWDDVPEWAMPFRNDHLGGATHLFMLAIGVDGQRDQQEKLFVQGWPDGHALFSPNKEHDWWGNALINAGFDWKAGETGPYYAQANAISSAKLCGVGLPYPPLPWQTEGAGASGGVHVSYFVVLQEVEAHEPDPDPDPDPLPPRFLQLLDKAEECGDNLFVANEPDKAAEVYLAAASLLTVASYKN